MIAASTIIVKIAKHLSLLFIDELVVGKSSGLIKKHYSRWKCQSLIMGIIYETIDEYEAKYPHDKLNDVLFPFYDSQIIIEELSKYVLFSDENITPEKLHTLFNDNKNIVFPTIDQVTFFYKLFVSKINNCNKLKKIHIEDTYKEKIFEMIGTLKTLGRNVEDIKNSVDFIKKYLIFDPENTWFNEQCHKSIADLNERYSPDLNFKLEISELFEYLGRTEIWKQKYVEKLDLLLKTKNKITPKNLKPNEQEQINIWSQQLSELINLKEISGCDELPLEDCNNVLNVILNEAEEMLKTIRNEKRNRDEGYFIGNFIVKTSDFINYIKKIESYGINNHFILLVGNAGVGKSHLLGNSVAGRMRDGYESIFLLGQQFATDESPWYQIFKILEISNISSGDFLNIVNTRAEVLGKKIIIFIDALNEGNGNIFWKNYISSFITEIRKFKWLGLVLTIRSSYKDLILSNEICKNLNIIQRKIHGFTNHSFEAAALFFSYYHIDQPNAPVLNPEFNNPLFLKLFCLAINNSGKTSIPTGLDGITLIFDYYINSIDLVLSRPENYNYLDLPLTRIVLNKLIEYMVDNDIRYMPRIKATEVTEAEVKKYGITKNGFLASLISEGLFSKDYNARMKEEVVYLAYEKFTDHLRAKYLLENHHDIDNEFKNGGYFYNYINNNTLLYSNSGLFEALATQIPERTGKEIFEYVSGNKNNHRMISYFINSLIWRSSKTLTKISINYVHQYILQDPEYFDYFMDTIISITTLKNNPFNADFIHQYLMPLSLADRDSLWTCFLKDKFDDETAVRSLVEWALDKKRNDSIDKQAIKLASITLAWFHTSTDRKLRDCSTKAMVNLLKNKLSVLIDVLKYFEGVNDPYVYERLFAVAYGCAMQTNDTGHLMELSVYVYNTIFADRDEIYPHILLRDYARGVIEYTHNLGIVLPLDIEIVRPPYKSNFKVVKITKDEINKKYKSKKESKWHKQDSILHSMITNYGHDGGNYGDFGRYTFQSALENFDIKPDELSRMAIEWIFEKYGYCDEKHGNYDYSISPNGRQSKRLERIGKKYQWLALHEMLARVSDNCKKIEKYRSQPIETFPYQGPWEPYVRDIDPSLSTYNLLERKNDNSNKKQWWTMEEPFNLNCENNEWFSNTNELNVIQNMISVKDEQGDDWLVLEAYPTWSEERKIGEDRFNNPYKELWCQIRSYIVKKDDFTKVINWALKQDFMGRWMPQSHDKYSIYSKEYYWAPCYKYCVEEDDEGNPITIWEDLIDPTTRKTIAPCIVTAEGYSGTSEGDFSIHEALSMLKPAKTLFTGMNMYHADTDGAMIDKNGEIICFDPSVQNDLKQFLLIRKEPFLKYLNKNNYEIFWTILGEKHILGNGIATPESPNWVEFSGVYYLNEKNDIEGTISSKLLPKTRDL